MRNPDLWHCGEMEPLTGEALESDYGPTTPVDADGNSVSPAVPADDARALLADAFDDLAARMSDVGPYSLAQPIPDGIRSTLAMWAGQWATDTAAGLRS